MPHAPVHPPVDRDLRRADRAAGRAARATPGSPHARLPRALTVPAAILALLTVAGLALLWPGAAADRPKAAAAPGPTLPGTVVAARDEPCGNGVAQACRTITVEVTEGPDRGRRGEVPLGPPELAPRVDAGDDVRLRSTPTVDGVPAPDPYTLAAVERSSSLLWLALAFAALTLLLARWRGLLALAGFALSLALITFFLVPSMLDGNDPVLVALVGSLAVMWVTLVLTYGPGAQTMAAALGIAASLGLAAILARTWVGLAHLDGRGSDLAGTLAQGGAVDLEGIVLAGMVIGALGVLADTGVTQASAVIALRRANPELGARAVYRAAFAIGRDHLTATVHTLVLAYVGASLPLILVLSSTRTPAGDALNTQDIAEPVVATLVGSIALLASVPLTTGLAALVAARSPASALPAGGGHAH
jgi:uncharacterized membrane protein